MSSTLDGVEWKSRFFWILKVFKQVTSSSEVDRGGVKCNSCSQASLSSIWWCRMGFLGFDRIQQVVSPIEVDKGRVKCSS